MEKYINKASVLIEALPYIQEFRNAIVVIKFGGSTIEYSNVINSILKDIVLLECVGLKPVIVHGGGKAINTKLEHMGIDTHFINGLRYTCDKTISVVDDVLHGEVNTQLVKSMQEAGGKAKTISGKDIIKAEKYFKKDINTGDLIDYGFVGEISDIDCNLIFKDIEKGYIPIITPLGKNDKDEVLNINADLVACKIAEKLEARKLIFISDVPGILEDQSDENSMISSIRVDEIEHYIDKGIIKGGMIPKIRAMFSAIMSGLEKVHIIDGRITHSILLEIFTKKGIGTQVIL